MVDQAVILRLTCSEPPVAIRIGFDLLDRFAAVLGDQFGHPLLDEDHLLSLDLDVAGCATDATKWLVHHDPRIRRGISLACGPRAQQELAHRCSQAHRDGRDIVRNQLHRVVNDHASRDRTAGRVDVERDVLIGILRREHLELLGDAIGVLVPHFTLEPDDPLPK